MTSNEPAAPRLLGSLHSVAGKGVVRMEDRFDADIDTVWAALTQAARLSRWLGDFNGELRLGGEYRARYFASGWEGAARVERCEPPRRLLVRTPKNEEQPDDQEGEVELTADGTGTRLVYEERGMPVRLLPAYGAGVQIHVEDLGAYLAGRGRCDADARWAELQPFYEAMPVDLR